jgi:amino acid adenylation domain-containing protein
MAAHQPVVTAFRRQATDGPRRIAVRENGAETTYDELFGRAARFAAQLRARGTGPGDLVAVRLPRGVDQLVAVVGTALAGAAYLPLDPAHPHLRAAAVLRLAGAGIPLVTTPDDAERWVTEGVDLVHPDAFGEPLADLGEYPEDRWAYVIYTSGSTGEPKGVVIDHHALAVFAGSEVERFGLGPGVRVGMAASPGFDASVFETWPALVAGATITVAGTATVLDPVRLRDWIVAERVEVLFLTTAVGTPLLRLPWPDELALRALVLGGERLTARPPRGLPFDVVNGYGPTEATVFATGGVVDPDGEGLPPIGKPVAEARLQVLDEQGDPVADGEVGELHIGGPGVAVGYLKRPDLTARAFTGSGADRRYRTGDLVRRRPDGQYDFVGRTDDQVKIRGNRVEPDELRATAERHPAVLAAHAGVRNSETPDAHLVLHVAPEAPTDLVGFLRDRLPAHLLPRHIVPVPSLPLTAGGKVDRSALPEPAVGAVAEPVTDELEALVAEVWCAVLGLESVGRTAGFFDLGGHSLLLVDVHRRLTDLGHAIDLLELFEHHTVAALADRLRGTAPAAEPDVELAAAGFRSGGRERLRRLRAQRRAAADGSAR